MMSGQWSTFLAVGLGSGLGAMCRHAISEMAATRLGGPFPFGTLAVNFSGSLILGALFGLIHDHGSLPMIFLTYGFLGGYTTFSAFGWQTILLAKAGRHGLAGANVAANFGGCLVGAAAGFYLAGLITGAHLH